MKTEAHGQTSHVIEMDGSVPDASTAVLSLVNNNGRIPQTNDPIMKSNWGYRTGSWEDLSGQQARTCRKHVGFFLESRFL